MRGSVHHLDLTVRDPWASRAFYDAVLGFMGYQLVREDARGLDWELTSPDGAFVSIGLKKSEGAGRDRGHDRYAPGLHHVAWRASSRLEVDLLYARLLAMGASVLDPPADYPSYEDGYYAVFFADPDGLKLEFVYTPRTGNRLRA
jgi:catechol 2,3-dioxygenase-like lactoylglutathione lyase family enzyme